MSCSSSSGCLGLLWQAGGGGIFPWAETFSGGSVRYHLGWEELGFLSDFLEARFGPQLMAAYQQVPPGFVCDPLRFLIAQRFCPVWVEVTSGFSQFAFRALDMCVSVRTWGRPPPLCEAWLLLNTSAPRDHRREVPDPAAWWRSAGDARPHGPRESIGEEAWPPPPPSRL